MADYNADDPAVRRNGRQPSRHVTELREIEADMRREVVEALADATHDRAVNGREPMSAVDRRRLAEAMTMRLLKRHFALATQMGNAPLTSAEERVVRANVVASVFSRLPALQVLLERPDVTDIMINEGDDVRVRTVDGREERAEPIFTSETDKVTFVRVVARKGGHLDSSGDLFADIESGGSGLEQEFSESRPVVDLRLTPSGARFTAVGPWVTINGCHISIRKHALMDADQKTLVRDYSMYDEALASFLAAAVRAGLKIVVSGMPRVGKTTLLRALAHELDPNTRIVQIEQNPELGLHIQKDRHTQVLAWIERPANMEGQGAWTLDNHVRSSQRHVLEYVIVGEVRGAEVIALLKAISMDVPGMCTIHAASASNVFSRLVLYAKESDSDLEPDYVLRAAAEAIDLIVHLRMLPDGRRVISEVLHVGDFDDDLGRPRLDEWFVPGPDGVASLNPGSPIPVDYQAVFAQHGFRHPGELSW